MNRGLPVRPHCALMSRAGRSGTSLMVRRLIIAASLVAASEVAWHLKLRAYVRRWLGMASDVLPCQLELEIHTIQQARIALWRAGTLKAR